MVYDKTVWVDHIVNPETGEVIQQGTPINAKNLNNIEKGIENIETAIGELFNFEAWANMQGATYTEEIQDDGSYINTLKINNVLKATRQSYPINKDGKFITVEKQYVDEVLIQTRTLSEWEENGIMKMEVV